MSDNPLLAGAVRLPFPTEIDRFKVIEVTGPMRSYTYPVLFNVKNPHLGTVVMLRHGERLFALTAAHNMADDSSIHLRLSATDGRTRFDILDKFLHPNYDPVPNTSKYDLAILELENVPAVQACDVSQLHTGGTSKLEQGEPEPEGSTPFAWVVGFPAELARPTDDTIVVLQTAFATQMFEYAADEFSLYFPKTAYQISTDGKTCKKGELTASPSGYSGGGVWAAVTPNDKPFNPRRHVKLVGLQTHWDKRSRMIRCVPAPVVAESLKKWKPELG